MTDEEKKQVAELQRKDNSKAGKARWAGIPKEERARIMKENRLKGYLKKLRKQNEEQNQV